MPADPPRADRPAPLAGVIHDLGYRPYAGERQGESAIAWDLFLAGLRNAFGLGRSGRSKILPFVLLGLNLAPALVLIAVMVTLRLPELPVNYAAYAGTTQMTVSVFAAAQAPVLFSRDLRHGSIVLYLARPLRAPTYALMRYGALLAALLGFLVVPLLVLYVGALLAGAAVGEQTTEAAWAVGAAVLLAAMVAGVTGLVSAWSTRRGFAVVASIAVLLFGYGVVAAVQGIARAEGADRVGEYAGLLSPYTLYRGIAETTLGASANSVTPPSSTLMEVAYLAAAVGIAVACAAMLVLRYLRVAAR